MFRYLLNRKISTRFGLTIALPLCALLLVLLGLVIEKNHTYRSMKDLRNLAQLAPSVSSLVHELQKERGASAGFISSRGKTFKNRLSTQKNLTNDKLKNLMIDLGEFDLSLYGNGLGEKIGASKFNLDQLENKRQEVLEFDLTVAQMAGYYTPTIAKLLSIIEEMALTSHDQQITSMVTAYGNILKGKERAGQERAMGSVGFGSGEFTPAIIRKFTKLIANQENYFQTFNIYATLDQKMFFAKTLSGPSMDDVERMRSVALDYPYTNRVEGIEGPKWFDAITDKIDLLKIIENKVAADLVVISNLKLEEARKFKILYAIIALVIMVMTGGLAFKLTRGITTPLDEAAKILANLALGNLDVDLSKQERRGEIGRIFSGLDKFKSAAFDLKRSEDSKSSILLGALDAIITVNMKGEIVEFNPSAEEMFGFSKDQVMGKDIADYIMPEELRDNHRMGFSHFAETGEAKSLGKRLELPALHADGSRIYIELSITHVAEHDLVTAFIQDITERKIAQEAIVISRDELEIRVQERTKELEAARKLADTANLAKSDFLSAMSHELRTPMNAILGFSQFLLQNPSNPLSQDQEDSVHHILKGGEHLLDLINDVLDLSKIEAGKIEVSIEDVSVENILAECMNVAENLDENITVYPVCDCLEGNSYFVKGDVTRLKQVLLNLMSNAVKYNREGGSVEIDCQEIQGNKLRILVKDTGFGIPEDKHELIFEPFNRLGAEVTEIEGTGIGLSITKRLIALMDGDIGFKSEVDVGSTFWIDLQLAGQFNKSINDDRFQIYEWRNEIAKVEGSKLLLYVEDNPMNLALMEKIIGQFSNIVLCSAHTAELGIAIAVHEKPDLIVMDVNLPGMSGIDATKELKSNEYTKQIPVVGLSARALPRDIKKGLEVGFAQYLTKPMIISEMVAAINDTIGIEPSELNKN